VRAWLHPLIEAAARLCFAYLRDQYGIRRRRPLARYLWRSVRFLTLGRRQPFIDADMDGLSVVVSTADRTIARSVYAAGDWDPLLVGTAMRALAESGWRPADRDFIEVGANFGVYCLAAVARQGFARALAYEPDPASYALLVENIRRNQLAGRVIAHNAALSNAPGELILSRGRRNAGDNRIVSGSVQLDRHARDSVRVPATTFDEQVAQGNIDPARIGLVWLDVQGHEPDMLEGAGLLLASHSPVVVEYSSAVLGAAGRARLDRLIGGHFNRLVDLGWSTLSDRVEFWPAEAVEHLAPAGRPIETDLLLLH
jgi:FkbM family methyltransferase